MSEGALNERPGRDEGMAKKRGRALNGSLAVTLASAVMNDDTARTGEVVARAGAEPVTAGQVQRYLERYCATSFSSNEKDMRRWMAEAHLTDDELRSETADFLADYLLVRQAITDEGICVDGAEVARDVNDGLRASGGIFGLANNLVQAGLSGEEYRRGVRECLERDALMRNVAARRQEPDQSEVIGVLAEMAARGESPSFDEAERRVVRTYMAPLFDEWLADYKEKANAKVAAAAEGAQEHDDR